MPRGGIESPGPTKVLPECGEHVKRSLERKPTNPVVPKSFLESGKIPILVSLRDGAHALNFPKLGVLDRQFD
jgi:hypothetical protein